MKLNRILAVALLAGALFLSACSDDGGGDDGAVSTEQVDGTTTTADSAASDDSTSEPTDGNDDAALDVCSMVDDATVTAVLGEPGTPTDDSTGGTIYGCTWAGEGEGLNVLHVSITVSADPAAAKDLFEMSRDSADSDILNLGDDAIYSETFGLSVLHGVHEITVDNTGPDEKQSDLKVAQMIIEQLS